GERSAWILRRWRGDHQNLRNWHSRLDRSFTNRLDQRRDALSRVPGLVRMHRLKVISAKHDDDQRQGCVDLHTLRKPDETVASGFERIFPDGAAAVQAIFNHDDAAGAIESGLHDARPTAFEGKAFPRHGNDSPRHGVTVNEDAMLHGDNYAPNREKEPPI